MSWTGACRRADQGVTTYGALPDAAADIIASPRLNCSRAASAWTVWT
jgi:hypothetical protein